MFFFWLSYQKHKFCSGPEKKEGKLPEGIYNNNNNLILFGQQFWKSCSLKKKKNIKPIPFVVELIKAHFWKTLTCPPLTRFCLFKKKLNTWTCFCGNKLMKVGLVVLAKVLLELLRIFPVYNWKVIWVLDLISANSNYLIRINYEFSKIWNITANGYYQQIPYIRFNSSCGGNPI